MRKIRDFCKVILQKMRKNAKIKMEGADDCEAD